MPTERVLALGSEDYDGGDRSVFNMAVMGFRLAQRANGVSLLHGEVSRGMFNGLWPAFDEAEVPIGSITNGVHAPTWVAREVMALADRANEFVEAKAPWALRKQEGKEEEVREVCSVALNLFRQLTSYLQPILPGLSAKANALLSAPEESRFEDVLQPLLGNEVGKFEHLMRRVDPERVQAMIEASAQADS